MWAKVFPQTADYTAQAAIALFVAQAYGKRLN